MSHKYGTVYAARAHPGPGQAVARLHRSVVSATAIVAALLAVVVDHTVGHAATPPPLRAAHAAVAADHPSASAVGLSVLRAGGNAVDAACATALALGVVHPFASGMGGGGFAVVYLAREKRSFALDFRERAPAAIKPELFLRDGKADAARSTHGGLAAGVPGEVRGLAELVRRWGKRPFGQCVAPAERLARTGFPVSWRLADALEGVAGQREGSDPRFTATFGGKRLSAGQTWTRPDLAWTLGQLRTGGAEAFYRGAIADQIVKAVRAAGGVMTSDDLRQYTAVERQPLETIYRGLRVVSMPPPSSGGTVLIQTLGILAARHPDAAGLTRLGRNGSAYIHLLGEAFKHGFADRARFLGDPDFVTVDVAHLTDPAYHRALAERIKDDGVLPDQHYGTPDRPAAPPRDGGTTHLSVIDSEGNAVALTTTINLNFGAQLVAGKTGIVLNNQMDDFSIQAGVPNAFGLIGSTQNAVAPNKRPLSSMTPTVVLDGDRVKLVVGAAGGPHIITATTQVLLNVVDWKLDAQAAVAAPRVHHQWSPPSLLVEPEIARDVVEGLQRRGHQVKRQSKLGVANVIVRTDRPDLGLEAGAEPRSPSQPAGY